jgi:branched-chain amino acid transport system ATP-binding protein
MNLAFEHRRKPPTISQGQGSPWAPVHSCYRTMLEIEALVVNYDEIEVLHGVSLRITDGEIVTLIGANGAGKTTVLRAISGVVKSRSGSIRFHGKLIEQLAPDAIVASGIAHVPEGRRIFPELSVEENLKVGGHLVAENERLKTTLAEVYELFPRLKERRRQPGGTLSGGEQQMLALGRAMMSHPRLLLLDEPSLGLAPRLVSEVARAVRAFRAKGVTVLLVEQNAALALSLADRGYVIERGRITLDNTAASLRRDPKVVASYLGGGKDNVARSEESAFTKTKPH